MFFINHKLTVWDDGWPILLLSVYLIAYCKLLKIVVCSSKTCVCVGELHNTVIELEFLVGYFNEFVSIDVCKEPIGSDSECIFNFLLVLIVMRGDA